MRDTGCGVRGTGCGYGTIKIKIKIRIRTPDTRSSLWVAGRLRGRVSVLSVSSVVVFEDDTRHAVRDAGYGMRAIKIKIKIRIKTPDTRHATRGSRRSLWAGHDLWVVMGKPPLFRKA